MRDRHQDRNYQTRAGWVFDPPAWLTSQDLKDLLPAAIEAIPRKEEALAIVDEYFAGDETFGPEPQHRQVLLWLLSLFWPCLANLLGGPPAD